MQGEEFTKFKMKDLGMMRYFLGMEVWQSVDGIFLGQGMYALEILNRFRMLDYKEIATPMASNSKLLSDASSKMVDSMMYSHMIGSLMFLMDSRNVHLIAANHILRYLKGIVD